MRRRNLFRKLKKGFTLVEMVIAIAVFAVFSAGTAAVLVPVLNVYSGAVQLSDAQLVAANILDAVQNELVYARPDREPEISEDGSLIEFNGVYPNTRITSAPAGETPGYLYIARSAQANFVPCYDERYYRSDTVEVFFAKAGESHALTVTVTVKDRNGRAVYTAKQSVTPLAWVS